MATQKDNRNVTDIMAIPSNSVTVLPPNSGVVGQFLYETRNMLKARAMRMNGLLRRINESGQRTEALLRQAAERMEVAEVALIAQFQNEGLLPDREGNEETEGRDRKNPLQCNAMTYRAVKTERSLFPRPYMIIWLSCSYPNVLKWEILQAETAKSARPLYY